MGTTALSNIQLLAMLETYGSTVTQYCINCLHYVPRHYDAVDFCSALEAQKDPVSGDDIEAVSCLRMRMGGPCGLDASLFEPRAGAA